MTSVPTLLLTGPTGVGKTTVALEISAQLEAAGVGHATIDVDELDRIHPAPPDDPHKTSLTRRNLAAVWSNLHAAGARRLILTMVAASVDHELPHLHAAVPGAEITVVRLLASEDLLLRRLSRREVGSGYERHARRTIEHSRLMARGRTWEPGQEPAHSLINVETSGSRVPDIAREVLCRSGWPVPDL